MNNDTLRRYIHLRDSLVREKAQLEDRLRELNTALGEADLKSAPSYTAAVPSIGASKQSARQGGRQAGLSLREAVLQVTANGPKTKEEILNGVKALGYRFSTNNPLNSLGVILYGKNPRFRNENGRFSPASGGGVAKSRGMSAGSGRGGGPFARSRRQLSPEARERIAAAQRARWAKTRRRK